MTRAVIQFALTGLAALVLLALAATFVLRERARSEAVRDARNQTELAGKAVIEPNLEPGIVRGSPAAVARLDRVVRTRLLGSKVVRVKLWTPDGRIVYSDEPGLVGTVYPIGEDEQDALATGRVKAELSDLSRPENRFERSQHKLLEVYLPVRTPDGKRLLYEQYLRYSSVAASGRRILLAFLPALIAALLLLEVVQVPLAWSLARRLREGHREREALLQQAIDASNAERRRIAADLHDGVVQDLAGLSYQLAAAAEGVGAATPQEASDTLERAAHATRQSMRSLRSLLVEIYPPNLHTEGLEAALSDLLAPAASRGLETSLEVPPDIHLSPEVEALLFRGAQEALRNVLAHAEAQRVAVQVSLDDGRAALTVADDGKGFGQEELEKRRAEGHFGLSLLTDLAASAHGRLEIDSEPGRGARVRLEVPIE